MPKENKLGAPVKYRKEMCDTVLELMSIGASLIEVAAALGICEDTLHSWKNPESKYFKKDFSESIKRGSLLSQAWWEKQGRLNLQNKDFSPALWHINMKNRFRWTDRVEQHNTGSIDTKLEIVWGEDGED